MKIRKYFFPAAFLIPVSFLLSCTANKPANSVYWYKQQAVGYIEQENDSLYRVQIGIMAAAFWLDKKNEHFERSLALLNESQRLNKKMDIGIEEHTNRIVSIKAVKNNK